MAIDPTSVSDPAPSWFTPKRLLVVFCVINMVNYIDRGAIATNGVNGSPRICTENNVCSDGSGIQGEFDLSNFKDGILSSAFMVGLLIASPIFASLAKSINPFRLIGVGLSVWTLAVVGCGLSVDFWSITICRMLVGVGEASFISLAAPFIDDNAPVAQRTAWLGIFYMCIPTGIAVGYVYGGLVGDGLGWRYAFFGEAILMLPFAILGFVMKPLQLKGMSNAKIIPGLLNEEFSKKDSSSYVSYTSNQLSRFGQDIKALLSEKVYVVNVLGYIAYNSVIGAYSYWGPKAGYSIYQMENADLLFGGVTIVGGIVGTIGGSVLLDRMNSTIPNAFKLLSIATFFGAVFCFSAFCFSSLYVFLVLFLIGEILVFATQGPVNFVCLHSVKPSLRPLSMAISTVSIHIFGDVPSSPLVGILQDKLNNWRTSALILTSVFFLAAGIWFIGIFLPSVDRYDEEDSEHLGTRVEQPDVTPLLESKVANGDSTSASL
ncbi:probable sphingolipid transporter spinster homolog 2 isoform X2 [Lactuca sativa]|uniref:probable sphingolipid transporter spinster homolog 2 isoform X2 n=1 Tax=Lactuca sativa TaxID=4236 RepID=UPI000CAAA36B|nr:probable sphingolipid transporter spinster homolog 2 isoform X2 [Lactuca sativa]